MANKVGLRRRMNEQENEEWYDSESGSNWVMSNDYLSDANQALFEEYSTEYDEIKNQIIGSSGKQIQRRCMNIFGRRLCICQFLEFIHAENADANHLCFVSKKTTLTKQNKLTMQSVPDDKWGQKEWLVKEATKVREMTNKALPNERPNWLPHYFWHWLHSAPHFHVMRHKQRVPWIASSAAQHLQGESMDYAQADDYYEYVEYGMGMDDEQELNALDNGDDFIGNTDNLSAEMWRIETLFLFLFIGILFCFAACCFVWRSKWGELIRELNQRRIDRNNRLKGTDEDSESSSLNISDVSHLNMNV